MYSETLKRRPTLIGMTHVQTDPGEGYVRGSWQDNDLQSRLGGGGGNTQTGFGGGALGFFENPGERTGG